MPFYEGRSVNTQERPDDEENAKQYKLEQEQRRRERELRKHKRLRDTANALGDRDEELRQKRIIRAKGKKLRGFIDEHGLTRNKLRERNMTKIDAPSTKDKLQVSLDPLKQEGEKATIPPSMVGNYDDFEPLAISEIERKAFVDLYVKTKQTGFEHAIVITSDGKSKEFHSELENKVGIDLSDFDDTTLKIYHSHTNDTLPSRTDFAKLLSDKVSEIGVVTWNGDIFTVSIDNGWLPSIDEFTEFIDTVTHEVNFSLMEEPDFYNWSINERNYMGIREQAYRIARHYEWTIRGGGLDE